MGRAQPAMWKQRYSGVEAVVAVVCAVLIQRLSTRSSELPAELVCWLILPVLFWITRRKRDEVEEKPAILPGNPEAESKPPRRSILIFALCIVASSYFKNEAGIIKLCVSDAPTRYSSVGTNKLQPAITPFLLAGQEALSPNSDAPRTSRGSRISSAMTTTWGSSLVAVFSTMVLLYWDLRASMPAMIAAVSLYAAYATLVDGTKRRSLVPRVSLEEEILPISATVVTLLAMAWGVRAFLMGQPEVDVASAFGLGVAKAFVWYTLARTACLPVATDPLGDI